MHSAEHCFDTEEAGPLEEADMPIYMILSNVITILGDLATTEESSLK